jgi:hypothetical protein
VTGLTSNPTIFERAIAASDRYDAAIRRHLEPQYSAERLFFDFALDDVAAAADLFRPIYDASGGRDGFASIEVSPTLADDAARTVAEGKALFASAERPNVLIKVPGTAAGLLAMEPPIGSSSDAMRDEKVKLLKAIRPPGSQDAVRGQFRGYREEPGVAPDSDVETFAARPLQIETWRWASVPFLIRAGKCMPVSATEVLVKLRPFRSASSPAWRSRTMPRTISDSGSVRRSRARSARMSSRAATLRRARGNPSSSSLAETGAG